MDQSQRRARIQAIVDQLAEHYPPENRAYVRDLLLGKTEFTPIGMMTESERSRLLFDELVSLQKEGPYE